MNEYRVRRTQGERSSEMKARLVEATLDCLQEHGYHGASLSVILDRAGVSRGAWAHHYDSKKDLVAAAAEVMFLGAVAKLSDAVDHLQPEGRRLEAMVEFLWHEFYQGRHRDVLFELANASRTDSELRARLVPVLSHFRQALGDVWQTFFEPVTKSPVAADESAAMMMLTMFAMRGMSMQSMLTDDGAGFAALRQRWAQILAQEVQLKAGAQPAKA